MHHNPAPVHLRGRQRFLRRRNKNKSPPVFYTLFYDIVVAARDFHAPRNAIPPQNSSCFSPHRRRFKRRCGWSAQTTRERKPFFLSARRKDPLGFLRATGFSFQKSFVRPCPFFCLSKMFARKHRKRSGETKNRFAAASDNYRINRRYLFRFDIKLMVVYICLCLLKSYIDKYSYIQKTVNINNFDGFRLFPEAVRALSAGRRKKLEIDGRLYIENKYSCCHH